jgi:glycosyltransferase involved in cell wall biosynthesis
MNNSCDILYICGTLEYGSSVSGNYILYKCLKNIQNVSLKILPVYSWKSSLEGDDEFLPYIPNFDKLSSEELISKLPKHKILFLSGNDFRHDQIHDICTHFGSKLVVIAMSHWIFGNTSHHPDLDDDFEGPIVGDRYRLYDSLDARIITASTNSLNIMKNSLFKNIKAEVIPFPLDEIDVYDGVVEKRKDGKKTILWGAQSPLARRKGKLEFEKILEILYNKCKDPNNIIIRKIGPEYDINTKFEIEDLGFIQNRTELSKVYKSSDVFALTTLADAGPMMVAECLKNETPVISFPTNISLDLIGDGKNGYIANSLEEYADSLLRLLYDNDFHIDLEYVKRFNSQEISYKKYNDFIKNLLNE